MVNKRKWLRTPDRRAWLNSLKAGNKAKYCYGNNDVLPSFDVEVIGRIGNLIEVKDDKGNKFLLSDKTGADEPVGKHTYMYILPVDI